MKTDMKIINEDFAWEKWGAKEIKNTSEIVKDLLKSDLEFYQNLEDKKITFVQLFKSRIIPDAQIQKIMTTLWVHENTNTDPKIREIARLEKLNISKLLTEYSYNEDVYNKIQYFYKNNFKLQKTELTKEEIKIVEDTIKSYKKRGMALPKEKKDLVIKYSNQISKLASEFDANCTKNYLRGVWFKKEELAGVSEDFISSLKFDTKTKKYFVSVLPTVMLEIKKYCTNKKTREKISVVVESGVGEKNNKKIREILKLRFEIAKILGFKTWSHLTMDGQLVSDPKNAVKFCENLIRSLTSKKKKENNELTKYLDKGEKLSSYNMLFLENLAQKNKINIKSEDLKKYFEFENTLKSLFDIWDKFFDLKVEFMRTLDGIHKDIYVYKVSENSTGNQIATIMFDLFPRDGKYGHACVECIMPRFVDDEENVHTATGIMLCNFAKNKNGKTLLSIGDVTTFFHEAGHLLHVILSKANYLSSSPFNTAIDYVEIPSQFLENFVTSPIAAHYVAKHVETGESLSVEVLRQISKMDDYLPGYSNIGLCMTSLFDLELHGKNILKYANKKGEINKLYEKFSKKFVDIDHSKTRDFPSRFAHMFHGYDSKYYSYMVSRVYAQDAWDEFSKKGLQLFSPKTKAYKKMLEQGGMMEEKDMLKQYLGRTPKQGAFLKSVNK